MLKIRPSSSLTLIALGLLCVSSSQAQAPSAPTYSYILSGASGTSLGVDDSLDFSVNGTIVYTDGNTGAGSRNPIAFTGKPGDVLTFVVRDTYGFCASLAPAFISCKGGKTFVAADPGFNLGCGRPSGNQGVVHTLNFTIPTSLTCQTVTIAAVEVTQSIQELQLIDDLKSSLTATGEPAVPIIAGKPAAMRIYLSTVTDATTVTVQLDGVASTSKTVDMQPNCEVFKQRSHFDGCPSTEIYFTPPSGAWTATITLKDSTGTQLDQQILNFKSRDAQLIHLISAAVCDAKDPILNFFWLCGGASDLIGKESLLTAIMPTNSVTFDVGTNVVTEALAPLGYDAWLDKAVTDVHAFYNPVDRIADTLLNRHSLYFGTYRTSLGSTGIAILGGRGGMTGSTVARFNADATVPVVAHEAAHTLGLDHTNTNIPSTATSPGCYNFAGGTNYWHHPNNYIQSESGNDEVGFNVATHTIIDPEATFELMGYCVPRWLSPVGYIKILTGIASSSPSNPAALPTVQADALQARPRISPATAVGPFTQVSGSIAGSTVTFNPLYTDTITGITDAGSGTYSIVVQNALGQPIYTRYFTPVVPKTDRETGVDQVYPAVFSEWIPVTTGAASIVVISPANTTIGTIALTNSTHTVTLTSPASGFVATGKQPISWTISPACPTCSTRVFYSSNNGAAWSQLGQVQDTTLTVDFTTLAGSTSAGAIVKVLITDGINTSSVTSPTFSVAKHLPSLIQITSPIAGYTQPAADSITLMGAAYDADDGMLHGTQLAWTSDLQGALGTGSPLSVKLNPGTHKLTLTATDSDGNAITATTTVLIGGARPTLTLTTSALSSVCTGATISAVAGTQGAALSQVQYSLDGGSTYKTIALTSLPFSFVVPGTGSIKLVARAYDLTNQSAAASTALTLPSACVSGTPSVSGGNTQNTTVSSAFTTPLAVLVKDATGTPVSGVTVTFAAPTSGASASLSAISAVTAANGVASVTATANATAGSYTITASVVGFSSPISYALVNTDFTLAVDSATINIKHGSTSTSTFTIAPLSSFAAPVTFACSGLPAGVTCTFAPASITPAGGNITTTLTLTATNDAKPTSTALNLTIGSGTAVFALCFLGSGLRRRKKYLGLLAIIGLAAVLANTTGCGANFTPFTSNVKVTATSSTLTHTQALTVNVQ